MRFPPSGPRACRCNGGADGEDAVLRIDAVVQRHFDVVMDVFQLDMQIVLLDAMRRVPQDQIAISIRPGESSTPVHSIADRPIRHSSFSIVSPGSKEDIRDAARPRGGPGFAIAAHPNRGFVLRRLDRRPLHRNSAAGEQPEFTSFDVLDRLRRQARRGEESENDRMLPHRDLQITPASGASETARGYERHRAARRTRRFQTPRSREDS